jgi:hypothetical protein
VTTGRGFEAGVHKFAAPVLVLFGVVAMARSSMQIAAMGTYHGATRLATMESAGRYDPGSYRIRMRLAEAYAGRGDCRKATPHVRAANGMFPNAAAPKVVMRRCGLKVSR